MARGNVKQVGGRSTKRAWRNGRIDEEGRERPSKISRKRPGGRKSDTVHGDNAAYAGGTENAIEETKAGGSMDELTADADEFAETHRGMIDGVHDEDAGPLTAGSTSPEAEASKSNGIVDRGLAGDQSLNKDKHAAPLESHDETVESSERDGTGSSGTSNRSPTDSPSSNGDEHGMSAQITGLAVESPEHTGSVSGGISDQSSTGSPPSSEDEHGVSAQNVGEALESPAHLSDVSTRISQQEPEDAEEVEDDHPFLRKCCERVSHTAATAKLYVQQQVLELENHNNLLIRGVVAGAPAAVWVGDKLVLVSGFGIVLATVYTVRGLGWSARLANLLYRHADRSVREAHRRRRRRLLEAHREEIAAALSTAASSFRTEMEARRIAMVVKQKQAQEDAKMRQHIEDVKQVKRLAATYCVWGNRLRCGCSPCCGERNKLPRDLVDYYAYSAPVWAPSTDTLSELVDTAATVLHTPQPPPMAQSQPAPVDRRIAVGEWRQFNFEMDRTRMARSLSAAPGLDVAMVPPAVVGGSLYAQVDGSTTTASPFMMRTTGATLQQSQPYRMDFAGRAIVFEWKDHQAEQIESMIAEANRRMLEYSFLHTSDVLITSDAVNMFGRDIEAVVLEAQRIGNGEWCPRIRYGLSENVPALSTPEAPGSQGPPSPSQGPSAPRYASVADRPIAKPKWRRNTPRGVQ
ncbi:hypothetical protein LTR36_009451 [Oleoguttula mirabilis]|uniref:Transmembrane protein n=1 Tax=Oleoguttula mirabilis TaxID=1507867 RepID=A0AAV9JSJ0_9PEZI|nr:hypothetical protein LTR36_009451 [Oleoguttula mirabilis]